MNYTSEMRSLRLCLGVDRTADVDMIVWAISQKKDEFDDIRALISERLPKELPISEFLRHASSSPMRIAEMYYGAGDYITCGFWATRAFERILHLECFRTIGYIPKKASREMGDIENLINCVCEDSSKRELKNQMLELKQLRNAAIHIERPFNKKMAIELMKGVKYLAERLDLSC
jgi:hypothetical protein